VGDMIRMVTIEKYSRMMASRLTEKIKTIGELRDFWIDP